MTDSDVMFIVRDGELTTMERKSYAQEAVLQELLATHPDVIGGVQTVQGDAPRRVALINQEFSIADGETSTFWVDHLFLDEDATPIFVETKRSTDTRIRREVIGQILDYVAHAAVNVPVESIKERIEGSVAGHASIDGADGWLLHELDVDQPATFWKQLERNLRDGRVRVLLVADAIPANTARVIEFLNEKLDGVEVLGIELPQYVAKTGEQVLAPRVIGRTSRAVESKGGDAWDEPRFYEWLHATDDDRALEVANQLLAHAQAHGEVRYGTGQRPTVTGRYGPTGETVPFWRLLLNTPPNRPYLELYASIVARDVGEAAGSLLLDSLRDQGAWSQRIAEFEVEGSNKRSITLYLDEFHDDGQHVVAALEALGDAGHL